MKLLPMMRMNERRYSPADYRHFPNKGEPWGSFKKWIMENIDYDLIDPDILELIKALDEKPSLVTFWSCFGHHGNRAEVDLWCQNKETVSLLKNIFNELGKEKLSFLLNEYPYYYSRFFIEGTDEEKRQIMKKIIYELKRPKRTKQIYKPELK